MLRRRTTPHEKAEVSLRTERFQNILLAKPSLLPQAAYRFV
jgi:hypothetical protein